MSKKKPSGGIPLESILLELNSPTYQNDPYRASYMVKELTQMLGRSVHESMPDRHTTPAGLTDAEYLEKLATQSMWELQRAAYDLYVADTGRRNINARHDAPGGAREQRDNHRRAYQAAYDAGEHTTHASFAKKHAETPGFFVDYRVLIRHLKGLPSARKKQTHTL